MVGYGDRMTHGSDFLGELSSAYQWAVGAFIDGIGVFATVAIAGAALFVSYNSLKVSREAQEFTERVAAERKAAEHRQRLIDSLNRLNRAANAYAHEIQRELERTEMTGWPDIQKPPSVEITSAIRELQFRSETDVEREIFGRAAYSIGRLVEECRPISLGVALLDAVEVLDGWMQGLYDREMVLEEFAKDPPKDK